MPFSSTRLPFPKTENMLRGKGLPLNHVAALCLPASRTNGRSRKSYSNKCLALGHGMPACISQNLVHKTMWPRVAVSQNSRKGGLWPLHILRDASLQAYECCMVWGIVLPAMPQTASPKPQDQYCAPCATFVYTLRAPTWSPKGTQGRSTATSCREQVCRRFAQQCL